MVVNTLCYNGFINGQPGTDGGLRIFLVGVYAAASIGHIVYTGALLCQSYTALARQACWIVLSRNFVFSHLVEYIPWSKDPAIVEMNLRSFQFELSGELKPSKTLKITKSGSDAQAEGSNNAAPKDAAPGPASTSPVQFTQSTEAAESKACAYIKALRKKDVTALEETADGCLEKVLANVVVLLGVCLAATLAPWTRATTATTESTAAQLGSYALLASLAAGATAMLSSATHLANAAGFMDNLALYPETIIRLRESGHWQGFEGIDFIMEAFRDFKSRNVALLDPKVKKPLIGGKDVTLWDVIRMGDKTRRFLVFLFGHSVALLPGRRGIGDVVNFQSDVCSGSMSGPSGNPGVIKTVECHPLKGLPYGSLSSTA
ncbi:hypothetical protein PG987_006298 [Apiospora arundinis]